MRAAALLRAAAIAAGLACGGPLWAQGFDLGAPVAPEAGAPILVLDFERAFNQSAFGRRLTREIEAAGARIAAENREIEAALTEEERRLTEMRDTMTMEEFRPLAEAFDAKVQRLRREQDAKARALSQRGDEARRAFLGAVEPVLQALMNDRGAQVILEARTVFAARDAIDITDRAIDRIDAAIGEGAALPPRGPDQQPRADDLPALPPDGGGIVRPEPRPEPQPGPAPGVGITDP